MLNSFIKPSAIKNISQPVVPETGSITRTFEAVRYSGKRQKKKNLFTFLLLTFTTPQLLFCQERLLGGDIHCLQHRQTILSLGIINDADCPIALAEVPEMIGFQTENVAKLYSWRREQPLNSLQLLFNC